MSAQFCLSSTAYFVCFEIKIYEEQSNQDPHSSLQMLLNRTGMGDPEGGGGQGVSTPPPPLKNHKNVGFLSNTGPDPL